MEYLLYMGLVVCLSVTQAQPNGFNMFNCTSMYAPHLGCEAYQGSTCDPVILKKEFPYLYTDGLEYPEKPSDFHVDISYKYYEGYFNASYPAFNLTIRPPITSSYKDVRGFEVTYMELIAGNTVVKCIIFNLTGQITTADKENEVTFRAEKVGPVSSRRDYLLRAYSLPKPATQYDTLDMSLSALIHTGPPFNATSPSSAEWTTVIIYRNFSRDIYFSFNSSPLRFNFERFDVSLYKVPDDKETSGPLVEKQVITVFDGEFKDLLPGWYRLKIVPEDPYFQDSRKCLCKDNRNNCATCTRTITAAIYIHEPSPTTPGPTPSTPGPTPSTREPSAIKVTTDPTGKIVGAVLGSFLGVILIVIIILFLIIYRRKQGGKQDPGPGKYVKELDKYQGQVNQNYVNNKKPAPTGPGLLKRQNVFLVNTEDHPKHLGVLKAFSNFLEKECLCNVTFAPDSKIDDKLQWIIRSMDMADFILVVHSSAAYLQYKSWTKNNGELCYQPLTKAGDIFVPALQQITDRMSRGKGVNKFLSIQFPYTADKFVIKELFRGNQYKIPTHLDEFLCHLHGLSHTQNRLEDLKLPVRVSIRLRHPGMNLIDAINEAAEYESMHSIEINTSGEKFDSGIGEEETRPIGTHNGVDFNSNGYSYENTVFSNGNYDYAIQGETNSNQLSPESPTTPQAYEYVDMQLNQGPQRQMLPKKRTEQEEMWSPPESLHEDLPAYLEVEGDNYSFQPHPPSQLGEEDVQSTQLRDEIHDINRRYMTKQFQQLLDINQEVDECESLGGMSV
ncbi:uncharacterized protein LOC110465195 isoform X2 [Mizuhopecten yessoensis]|uniref:uncharacterized protein LOC110465195 isoform X2 n=1 Tax=Mizuhopecten yessoensis TaxID=6573 RepID=UPI000B45E27B|nr:uncharacterized protein LOC110465195 isoform X2 [Mizuhopecten yessoensis]